MQDDSVEEYAKRQREFWNTPDERTATYERVDTVSDGDENRFSQLAESTGEMLMQNLQLPTSPTIAEIGCGVGRMVRQMKKRIDFSKFYAVDISESMVAFSKKNTGDDSRIQFIVNSGYDLSDIPTESCDFCFSVDVFIHIFDAAIIENYLKEIFRILKPKGVLRFDVRHLDVNKMFGDSIGGRFAKFLYSVGISRADNHRWKSGEPAEFHGNKFREPDLRKLVTKTGFMIQDCFVRSEDTHLWCFAVKK